MTGFTLWKVVHITGVLLLFGSLGALASGRQRSGDGGADHRVFRILHGVALLLVFVAGFGALAALGVHSPSSWGAWVWIKLAIWFLLGAGAIAVGRARQRSPLVLGALVALGGIAAWYAVNKG